MSTARCGCGAIVQLPHAKSRAYAAKCGACHRKQSAAVAPMKPAVAGGAVHCITPGAAARFASLFDAHKDSGPPGCECPPCAERREQRSRDLTAEKRWSVVRRIHETERQLPGVQALCGFAAGRRFLGVDMGHGDDAVYFTESYGAQVLWPAPGQAVPLDNGDLVPPAGITVPLPLPAYWNMLVERGDLLTHDPRKPKPQTATVTHVDHERGVITFSSGDAVKSMGASAANFEPGMRAVRAQDDVDRIGRTGKTLLGECAVRDDVAAKRHNLNAKIYEEACREIAGLIRLMDGGGR